MYEEIERQIILAEKNKCKIAMFHYQVLTHADKLLEEDPVHFCREVGVNDSYAIEFGKMLRLSKMMKQMGTTLTTKS